MLVDQQKVTLDRRELGTNLILIKIRRKTKLSTEHSLIVRVHRCRKQKSFCLVRRPKPGPTTIRLELTARFMSTADRCAVVHPLKVVVVFIGIYGRHDVEKKEQRFRTPDPIYLPMDRCDILILEIRREDPRAEDNLCKNASTSRSERGN